MNWKIPYVGALATSAAAIVGGECVLATLHRIKSKVENNNYEFCKDLFLKDYGNPSYNDNVMNCHIHMKHAVTRYQDATLDGISSTVNAAQYVALVVFAGLAVYGAAKGMMWCHRQINQARHQMNAIKLVHHT